MCKETCDLAKENGMYTAKASALPIQNIAMRSNAGKTQWSLVDFEAIKPMVDVLMFGAKKYAPNNWKKGQKYTDMIDCLLRHVMAIARGENIDPESGLPHIGHVLCNGMFISYMMENKPQFDDRFNNDALEAEILEDKRKAMTSYEIKTSQTRV